MFNELFESVKEGAAILRGDKKPARTFKYDDIQVKAIREKYGLSQPKFAQLIGISVKTLQNWEQGRRRPVGPARVLLKIAEKNPKAIIETTIEKAQTV